MKTFFSSVLVLAVAAAAATFVFKERLPDYLNRVLPAAENQVSAERVVLQADNASHKDAVWEKRYYYGKRSWGIRGSGHVESGSMRFSDFPGADGKYRVMLGAIFEADGSPKYRLSIGQDVAAEGSLPYHGGSKDCEARGAPQDLDLGVHQISRGEDIELWGESVYECGEKGAYLLWYELRFEPLT